MSQRSEAPLFNGIGSLHPADAAGLYPSSLDCGLEDGGLGDSLRSRIQESSRQGYLEMQNANHQEWPPCQVDAESKTDDLYTEDPSISQLIRQPETRPISEEELAAEIKAIYAGLVMVESKCIEVDNAQSADKDPPQWPSVEEKYPFLSQFDEVLLNAYYDFPLASQYPFASLAPRPLTSSTLTKFIHRIKSKLVDIPKRLRLRYLGQEKQRLMGYLNGHFTAAFPDTGSDVMLIDSAYAQEIGLDIDYDIRSRVEVEFADGSTTWTRGIVRDVPWSVGGKTVHCDFHVLDDLCVDVILSNGYLFEMNIFSEYGEYFFDDGAEEDLFYFCNIRLIGQYSEELNILEESYMEDVASPSAFNPETIQRELARRDLIRDKILALPESQQEAAAQAESRRQMHWEALRHVHRARWATNPSAAQLPHTPRDSRKTKILRAIHKLRELF
ncbi:hypothetical protein TARUN_6819 [Trichoderma arundinaceum]|uniref:Uncharacterized protein n=1 Tax=Trichoderma arundinaceum TaxID=490622 RepID=A0A395NH47_TRIAR|nr:hypothetical protein TARUN_6819 [Trichoderma arundinaceum]